MAENSPINFTASYAHILNLYPKNMPISEIDELFKESIRKGLTKVKSIFGLFSYAENQKIICPVF